MLIGGVDSDTQTSERSEDSQRRCWALAGAIPARSNKSCPFERRLSTAGPRKPVRAGQGFLFSIDRWMDVVMAQKKCSRCKTAKDVAEFYKNVSAYDGLNTYCKECDKERQRTPEVRNYPSNRKRWANKLADHLRLNGSDY